MQLLSRRDVVLFGAAALVAPGLARAEAAATMPMDGLYGQNGEFSEQAKAFNGTQITIDGFMAPPLKPDVKFFVLGTDPMAICPFCDTASQWPQNIVLVYPKGPMKLYNYDQAISVTGKLDLGVSRDGETGFVSKVRLIDAEYKGLPGVAIGAF